MPGFVGKAGDRVIAVDKHLTAVRPGAYPCCAGAYVFGRGSATGLEIVEGFGGDAMDVHPGPHFGLFGGEQVDEVREGGGVDLATVEQPRPGARGEGVRCDGGKGDPHAPVYRAALQVSSAPICLARSSTNRSGTPHDVAAIGPRAPGS